MQILKILSNDFNAISPNNSAQNLATALATPIAGGIDLLFRQKGIAGPLQRIGVGPRVGCADAGGNDCDLHLHLCGYLRRALRRERFSLGLRSLSLLRSSAVVHVP